jgi:hypothetical protein
VTTDAANEHEPIIIFIDQAQYRAPTEDMSGEQIRQLVHPPISAERDLWLEVPGGSDEKIGDSQVLKLKNGTHFFTAPARINPGNDAARAR